MSYNILIDRECRRAFALLKDLRKTVVVTRKTPASFDFATAELQSTQTIFSADILFTGGAKKKDEPKSETGIMLVKAVGELKPLDILVDGSDTWVIKSVPNFGTFTLQLELERMTNG